MRWTSALLLPSLLAAALCAGCLNEGPEAQSVEASAGTGAGGPAETSTESVSGAGGMPEATTIKAPRIEGDLAGATDVSSSVPFVAKPQASGGFGYDADTVLAVRYEVNEDYERAVIDLGTGLEPAGRVPKWSLVSQEGNGLLRVTLPSASATCVSDGRFGGGLLESFHVVRAPEGGMFIDIFTRKAFLYRVVELGDPARLVVDFKSKGDLKAPLPAVGGDTVLVEPRQHASISDPLTVNGYSRDFEAANVITLIDSDGKVLVRRSVPSNDGGRHTWGYFEATLDLPSLSGNGTLKVGTENAQEGSFEGVEIPVRTR
ncbi:MAG TPA: Gmad2 immunoglobulin-like domain-containing protein [Rubrobacter sp.]|nr:Gmad2 immunoglobulin-like domain-containing protein [Rubrobacter sp.]